MPFRTPVEWMLETPVLLGGIVVWVVGWLLIELLYYRGGRRVYSLAEARVSLSTFAIVSVAQVGASLALLPILYLVWPHRLFTQSMASPWPWLWAWVITDFAYYWIHRMLHATRLGWAFHAPHHSTRQLSLLDSLRTSWGEQPVGVIAYGVPLVLLGIPPYVAGIYYLFVALYQFAVHTEIDWSLGPLDGLVYTPAAHRSHHSTDRAESDRNFGGFFAVFDRLFGTWQANRPDYRPAAYGLPPADSDLGRDAASGVRAGWDPHGVRAAAFGEMIRVYRGFRAARGLAKLRYLLTR